MAKPRSIRKRARKDDNHAEIVRTFEGLNGTWLDTSHIGGALDGILGVAGIDQRVEIKDGDKSPSRRRLTADEKTEFQEWQGRSPVIIESIDEAINLVNELRREAYANAGNPI